MFGKGSKLYSITRSKCPHCHEGDIFKSSIFEGVYNMHQNCPVCGQRYEIEPGFFWGAMYVGYGLSSAYMLTGFAICMLIFKLSMMQSFMITIIPGLIIMLYIARLARVIWMNIYIGYDPTAAKKLR